MKRGGRNGDKGEGKGEEKRTRGGGEKARRHRRYGRGDRRRMRKR